MKKNVEAWMACGAAVVALFAAGCDNTAEGVKQDTREIGQEAAATAREVDQKVDAAGREIKQAAAGAGREVVEATRGAGKELKESTVVSPTVLGAIAADPQLKADGNEIEVKTEDGVVYLRGYVKSEALKKRASEVAMRDMKRIEAKETLKNELQVRP
jgi:predicted small secreted protein